MKVSELSGAQLDYWVAKIEGMLRLVKTDDILFKLGGYSPSTKWAHGGPIIERERIDLECLPDHTWFAAVRPEYSYMDLEKHDGLGVGETILEAAMRAYVYGKFGDEVEE